MTDFEILIVGYPGISGKLPGNFSQVTREFWILVAAAVDFHQVRILVLGGYPGISERLPGNFGYPGISTTANSATTTATTTTAQHTNRQSSAHRHAGSDETSLSCQKSQQQTNSH